MKETIYVCNGRDLEVVSFTKEGNQIKCIKTGESGGRFHPIIRADPFYGRLWVLEDRYSDVSKLICINENEGKEIQTFDIEERINYFFIVKFQIFFSNQKGIFYFCPEKKEKKMLYEFKEKSKYPTSISVLGNKMFISFETKEKCLIKIFKIFY